MEWDWILDPMVVLQLYQFSHSNELFVYGPEKYYLPLRNDIEIFHNPQRLSLLFLSGFPQEGSDVNREMDAIL